MKVARTAVTLPKARLHPQLTCRLQRLVEAAPNWPTRLEEIALEPGARE